MNLRKHLIKSFIVLILTFLFIEKSLSIEPDKFIQNIVDEASEVLVKNYSKEAAE